MCNFDTDIGTEELAHLEMVATIVHQLTKNLSMEEIEDSGFSTFYVDHTVGIWPQFASGMPLSAAQFQSTGDIITDLMEDMAAEQKARTIYDNILRLVRDEPDVYEPIKFLRAREIVHFQRFGDANRIVYRIKDNTIKIVQCGSHYRDNMILFPFNGFHMFLGEPGEQTVAFMRVDNINALYSFVKKNGWTQISEITTQPWGGKECDVTTIDGGIMRFFQLD